MLNQEEKPLHVGEVMNLWKIMTAFAEGRTLLLVLLNHASDAELKRYIESFTKDFEEAWMKRLTDFMRNEVLTGTTMVQATILDTLHYGLARMLMELELAAYRQAFVLRQLMEQRAWMSMPPAWNQRSRPT